MFEKIWKVSSYIVNDMQSIGSISIGENNPHHKPMIELHYKGMLPVEMVKQQDG